MDIRGVVPRLGLAVAALLCVLMGLELASHGVNRGGMAKVGALTLFLVGVVALVYRMDRAETVNRLDAERGGLEASYQAAAQRASQLEDLLAFGQALAASDDPEYLERLILELLPPIVGTRDIWIASRVSGWMTTGPATAPVPDASLLESPKAWEMFPLRFGGKNIGVLAVRQQTPAASEQARRITALAASIIAISLRNAQLVRKVKEQSLTDPLTGCVTRQHGLDLLAAELRRAQRSKLPLTVIMADADHFKTINDRLGHLCGDEALRTIGVRLKTALRVSDVRCRYGGEEFLLILPDTSSAGGLTVAESVRAAVSATPILCGDTPIRLTISCGIATGGVDDVDPAIIIGRADAALYRAKRDGRNGVRMYAPPDTPPGLGHAPGQRELPTVIPAERRNLQRPDRRRVYRGGRRVTDRLQTTPH